MKKIIFTLVLILSISAVYSQGKYHYRQNTYYVEAAAKEFSLDKKQQKELSEVRMEMVKAYMTSNKAFKNEEITKEEKKAKNREASQTYHKAMSKITGKSYKEMKPFLDRLREELKTVK